MSDITKVDVLVSGAGPTGLFITYLLARQGHSVYCLDPKPGPTDQSRAILLTSRTMEILESKGLVGEFLAEGFVSSGIRMYRKGTVFGHVDALGDTPFPHMTIVMQSKTEEILTRHIKDETDCTVHWSTEFVSYTQDDEKVVSVVLDKTTGQEHKIESRFIVGADGSHSRVRKGNPEFTYEGIAVTTKFFLADLSIHGENIENMMDRMNTFMFESHVMGMIRIYSRREGKDDSHVFRIFGNVEAYNRSEEETTRPTHGLQKEEPPKLEEIQAFVDRVTAPLKFTLSDLIWSSYFRINERITNKYRIKRAFLIGDAAHCHSPAGGQGMNLGLQDADNLAWKLSLVLNGQAADPETLLDSYHIEREPHAASTIKVTSRATQAGITEGFLARNIRETAMSTMMMIPQVREYAFKNVMQLFVTVDGGSNLLGTSDKGLIKAGHFLPDSEGLRQRTLEKRTSLIRRLNLHEILIGTTQYTAILVATCPSQAKPRLDLLEKFWIHARPYPVKRIIVESSWHTHFNQYPLFVLPQEEQDAQTSFYSEERMDSPYSVTSRVGLLPLFPKYFDGPSPCVLMIVRPDLYVAQSKTVYNENDLVSALEYFKTHLLSKPN